MLALQHFLGQPIGPRVGVVRELAKLRVDAPACLAAEQVREVHGAPAGSGVALPEPLGPRARRGHGEQLGAHVHQSEQHGRSEEHTSELQSLTNLVCRLLLEKKKKKDKNKDVVT